MSILILRIEYTENSFGKHTEVKTEGGVSRFAGWCSGENVKAYILRAREIAAQVEMVG